MCDAALGRCPQQVVVPGGDDPDGGRFDDARATPLEQRAELLGSARCGDRDGEPGEGQLFHTDHRARFSLPRCFRRVSPSSQQRTL